MSLNHLIQINPQNRKTVRNIIATHFLWSCCVLALALGGSRFNELSPAWSFIFIAVQLYAAAQLIRPALKLQPEQRHRGFYLFWAIILAVMLWLVGQLDPSGTGRHILPAFKSGFLLFTGTLIAVALARYIKKLWEIIPICLAMSIADFSSWLFGPTANFAQEIEAYYLKPEGPPPLIDMVLVKLSVPGSVVPVPVFGISDWIMAVFFAVVAYQHQIKDNLIGLSEFSENPSWRYLPVSLAALLAAVVLAQATGLFIPALPVIAAIMLLWMGGQYWLKMSQP